MFFRKKDHHEFRPLLAEIEEEPLNPLGRTVFWVIIGSIVFFGLWLFFGTTDVVVTGRGKVIPVGEVKTLQPLNAGVVRRILVKPGDLVEKGQVLMEIDPSEIDPELESTRKDLAQVRLELMRLRAQSTGGGYRPDPKGYDPRLVAMQQDIFTASRQRLESQVRAKTEAVGQVGERLAAKTKTLHHAEFQHRQASQRMARLNPVRDLLSRDEIEKAESELKTAETQLQTEQRGVEELRAGLRQARHELALVREEDNDKVLAELAEKKQREAYLVAKIEQAGFRSSRQYIASPVKGHVGQVLITTIGGVVTPAEKLATVVPLGMPLTIKAIVQNKDVGFLRSGMPVSIKIDTFDFQKYGVLDGSLLHVSRDSIEDKNLGLVYEVYVKPLQTVVKVDGKDTPVSTGMSVSAEIKVGKRRIIEFFVYPLIKYLNEGISVR
jgi:hemolysin D